MNKYIKYPLIAILSGIMLSSCDIKRFPKNAMVTENALLSVNDLQKWDMSAMAFLRGRFGGYFRTTSEIQAGMINAGFDFGNRQGEFYFWTPLQAGTQDIKNIWYDYYSPLKNINMMINKGAQIKPTNDDEKAVYNQCLGDAHLFRAYYNYNIAIRFAKAYNPKSAGSDEGIPLVKEYDVEGKPARSSMQETFDFIKSDIETAKKYLAQFKGAVLSQTATIDACYALEARVCLYMQDWSGAATAASKLTNSSTYSLVKPEVSSFQKMWYKDNSTEDIFTLFISKPDELPNGNGAYIGPDLGVKDAKVVSPDWLPSQWVIDMYSDADLRKPVYFEKHTVKANDQLTDNIYCIFKFKGNDIYSNVTDHESWGIVPSGRLRPKIFRLAEQYLILAEASYRMGSEDNAKTALNALRVSRGLRPVSNSGDMLLKDIQKERMRELAFEGFYFFDLKRWGMPMHRHNPQVNTDGESPFLKAGTNSFEYTVEPNNYRWVWPIPHADMQTNPNLAGHQNPGW